MKKDSNMFNDNSTETEGIPADKTAEIPKVVDSTEEENAKKPLVFFGREFSRKQVCVAGAGILCAAPSHRRRGLRHLTCQLDGRFQCPCGVPVKGR